MQRIASHGKNANEGRNSCASLAGPGLVLSFIVRFIACFIVVEIPRTIRTAPRSRSAMTDSKLPTALGDSLKRNEPGVTEAADPTSWKRLLDDAADVDLWDGVRRHERPGWKEWLDAADKLTAQPRKPLPQVSEGAITSKTRWAWQSPT